MLTMTENAAQVVKTITAQTTEGTDAGLRISGQQSDPSAFGLNPAEAPEPGDQIVEDHGARLFLDEPAAVALGDEVLDAQVDPSGDVQFGLAPKA
jgi:Fe-S cluster assembly iron-binding protein IscA